MLSIIGGLAVDGEDKIVRAGIDADLGERGAELVVPVLAAKDAGDLPEAGGVVALELGAEEPKRDLAGLRDSRRRRHRRGRR